MADGDPEAKKEEAAPDAPEEMPEAGTGGTSEEAGEGPSEEDAESPTGDDAEPGAAQHRMTMMEHLVELRRRLMWCVVALLVAFGICIFFASEIFDFLSRPLMKVLRAQNEDATLIYTKLYEVFFTEIKIGFYAAAFLAFPIFAIQMWKFVAPGLYTKEKGAFRPFLIATPILFFAGGAMVYYAIMPLAWNSSRRFRTPARAAPGSNCCPRSRNISPLSSS